MEVIMNAEEFRETFEKMIAATSSPMQKYEVIVALLASAFHIKNDEVAIFSYDSSREVLVFVWPQSLKSVGSIPLNAHRCLVSKTAVEKKGVLDNSFASTPHLYMFEHFLSEKAKRVPIQKIMSVPVIREDQLKGVVQVARKGADRDSSGADFSSIDLALLTSISGLIGECL
jgi:GAF domain-containing protein